MLLPSSSMGPSRHKGVVGYLDDLYRKFLSTYNVYLAPPLLGLFFLFSVIGVPSIVLPKQVYSYFWYITLVLVIVTIFVLAHKRLKHGDYRRLKSGLLAVGGLFVLISVMHFTGLVPLSAVPEPIVFLSPGQSYLCPASANYYGTPGCSYSAALANGISCNLAECQGIAPQNTMYTCPTEIVGYTNTGCYLQFGTTSTSSTMTTTFTETGLSSGTPWYITYDGMRLGAYAGASITFTTSSGTYDFSAAIVNQIPYTSSPSSGQLTAGSTQQITYTYVAPSTSTSSSTSSTTTGTISGSFQLTVVGPVYALASFLYLQ